jgi:cysteinyl-tRNA synthetase
MPNPKSETQDSQLETLMPIHLYNTASRSVEEFEPIEPGKAGLYSCGPTVYHYAHLGNLRAAIFADTLKRVLQYNDFQVTHVMNITDVGHLVSDQDAGEDKLEKGARRQGQTVWQVARFYEDAFVRDIEAVGNQLPTYMPRATEHIAEQIELIQQLMDKGYTYQTDQAVYYDVTKFPHYSDFSRQPLEEKQVASRQEVQEDPQKKYPADFALWFFTTGRFADHAMRWPSPWGQGFPGWHIECSAMSMKYLGPEFDLHTGGIEHIGTHHTNEIAQSEAATGRQFAHYWLHNQHLTDESGKMAKSNTDFLRLQSIIDRGFTPLDYRYFILSAHYRSIQQFSWEALQQAATTLKNLKKAVVGWSEATEVETRLAQRFHRAINDDLDTPTALSIVWEMIDADLDSGVKRATLNKFEQLLGLGLYNYQNEPLTDEEQQLIDQRQQARAAKDWAKADQLRHELIKRGVEVEDTVSGPKWVKLS